MTYLRTQDAVVTHIDSNAAQFARAGNPWDGEGQLRPKTAGKREPEIRTVRRPAFTVRPESEAMFEFQCRRELARKLQADSGKSRVMAPTEAPAENGLARFLKHPNLAEAKPLTAAQRRLSAEQRADFAGKAAAAQLAYDASHDAREGEKRALKARILKLKEQLASL